eukprot:Awhi_evm1s7322
MQYQLDLRKESTAICSCHIPPHAIIKATPKLNPTRVLISSNLDSIEIFTTD